MLFSVTYFGYGMGLVIAGYIAGVAFGLIISAFRNAVRSI